MASMAMIVCWRFPELAEPCKMACSCVKAFPRFQEVYSGCCTNPDRDILSFGTVVGFPVARLGAALLNPGLDLRRDDPLEVAASGTAKLRYSTSI
jgi:hypothetical protein